MTMVLVRLGTALGVCSALYSANKAYENYKLNQEKLKLYKLLNLGNYSEESYNSLDRKKIEHLCAEELQEQLETYGSWGRLTTIERLFYEPPEESKVPGLSRRKELYYRYLKTIHTVDCTDAGMPYGDRDEIIRCNKLKERLYSELENDYY